MKRPSTKELNNKIRQAKEAVQNGEILIIYPIVIASDAIELGYQISELQEILSYILVEISPEYYTGSYPPQRAYKKEITGLELFAFRWNSKIFGCKTYLKFSLKQSNIFLVSLHPDRAKKGK